MSEMHEDQSKFCMRNNFLYLLLLVCCCLSTGCSKKNALRWEQGKATLTYEGKAQEQSLAGGVILRLEDGKPVMQSLKTEGLLGDLRFPQYAPPVGLAGGELGVKLLAGKLSLEAGTQSYTDEMGLGIIVRLDAAGQAELRLPQRSTIVPTRLGIGLADASQEVAKAVRRIDFLKEIKSQHYMALTRIEYIIGDDQRRYIPNDTGTDVIILDGFHVVGNCNADPPSDCCTGDAVDPNLDYSGWVSEYAADGRRLLACFPHGSICTFTDGDKLIVIVCQTQERYCLSFSTCPITITTTDGQGICFSVPLDCSMENPFG
jgi:hypothetical protein